MANDWDTTADFTFAEQDLWKSKNQGATSNTDFKIASEAPEDIHLTFEELDITPQEIQGDNFYVEFSQWTQVDQSVAVGTGGWTNTFTGGTEEE